MTKANIDLTSPKARASRAGRVELRIAIKSLEARDLALRPPLRFSRPVSAQRVARQTGKPTLPRDGIKALTASGGSVRLLISLLPPTRLPAAQHIMGAAPSAMAGSASGAGSDDDADDAHPRGLEVPGYYYDEPIGPDRDPNLDWYPGIDPGHVFPPPRKWIYKPGHEWITAERESIAVGKAWRAHLAGAYYDPIKHFLQDKKEWREGIEARAKPYAENVLARARAAEVAAKHDTPDHDLPPPPASSHSSSAHASSRFKRRGLPTPEISDRPDPADRGVGHIDAVNEPNAPNEYTSRQDTSGENTSVGDIPESKSNAGNDSNSARKSVMLTNDTCGEPNLGNSTNDASKLMKFADDTRSKDTGMGESGSEPEHHRPERWQPTMLTEDMSSEDYRTNESNADLKNGTNNARKPIMFTRDTSSEDNDTGESELGPENHTNYYQKHKMFSNVLPPDSLDDEPDGDPSNHIAKNDTQERAHADAAHRKKRQERPESRDTDRTSLPKWFTEAELRRMRTVTRNFARDHDMTEPQVHALILTPSSKGSSGNADRRSNLFDRLVAAACPGRERKKVVRRAKALFQIKSRAFSAEDDVILESLYRNHGAKWIEVGHLMDRDPDSVRKRWRNHLMIGKGRRTGRWDHTEEARLIELVVKCLSRIQASRGEPLARIAPSAENDIPWPDIGVRMRTRDGAQCKSKWEVLRKRAREFASGDSVVSFRPEIKGNSRWRKMTNKDKNIIIRSIRESGAALDGHIPWAKIGDADFRKKWGREAIVVAWERLKRAVPDHDTKSVRRIAQYILDQYHENDLFEEAMYMGFSDSESDVDRGGNNEDLTAPGSSSSRVWTPGAEESSRGRRSGVDRRGPRGEEVLSPAGGQESDGESVGALSLEGAGGARRGRQTPRFYTTTRGSKSRLTRHEAAPASVDLGRASPGAGSPVVTTGTSSGGGRSLKRRRETSQPAIMSMSTTRFRTPSTRHPGAMSGKRSSAEDVASSSPDIKKRRRAYAG